MTNVHFEKMLTSAEYHEDPTSHFHVHEQKLKDDSFTSFFLNAIKENKHLFQGKVVLNIGCGLGIFAMAAADAGAAMVFAVDNSQIVNKSQLILTENKYKNRITLIKGDIKRINLPTKIVDIIISDWMRESLFLENNLEDLISARDHWLSPFGFILPDYATLFIAGIEDDFNDKLDMWDNMHGVDMSHMKECLLHKAHKKIIESSQICTKSYPVKRISLYNVNEKDINFSTEFNLISINNCSLNGLILYFTVEFRKTIPKMIFSTSPRFPETHFKHIVLYQNEIISACSNEMISGNIDFKHYKHNGSKGMKFNITLVLNGKIGKYKKFQKFILNS